MQSDELLLQAFLNKAPPFRLEQFLFKQQYDFVNDPNPFKTAVCSRRAGKTVSCAAHLIHTAVNNPGVVCLYITLSRSNAKKILWPELQRINREHKLGGVEDLTELSMRFNESVIYCSGANDKSEIEKFRGLAIKLCYIDECQSFKEYIRDLIDEIIAPALMDYAGSICLIGTPRAVPAGYFYECSNNENTWSKHAWNFFDNPFIEKKSGLTHRELLDRELARRGVTPEDPGIQREWFGKWALDLDSLLLRYDPKRNDYNQLPAGTWNYLLGIDLGYVDADALAVLAWSESLAETYLVEEIVVPKEDITALIGHIRKIQQSYSIAKMVIDEGGLGKKLAEELRRRHQIPLHPADKVRKMENLALLNDALMRGHFKAKKDSRFAQDTFLVEVDRDRSTPEKIKIKDGFHSDIIDAVLYAFRESPAYAYVPPVPKPKAGTPEWAKEEVSRMEEEAKDYFTKLEESEKGWANY